MAVETVNAGLVTLSYDTITLNVVLMEIQLGDSLTAKFDDEKGCRTYGTLHALFGNEGGWEKIMKEQENATGKKQSFWRKPKEKGKEGFCILMDPVEVYMSKDHAEHLYRDLTAAFNIAKTSVTFPNKKASSQ